MRRAHWVGTAAVAVVLGLLWVFAPAALGGQTSYISTYGDSMEPKFRTGDLALVRPSESYQVGDVVAYSSDLLQTAVMHRIVDIQDGRFTFKGDNNSWIDPEQPRRDQLIGTLTLRIPQGGVWLARLTSPPMLAVVAFGLVTSGGVAATRRNRRRKRASMSRHTSTGTFNPVAGLTPVTATAAVVAASAGVLGLVLAGLAWTGPLTQEAAPADGTSMVFSYSADVGDSPAYDGTTAESPDPVFRKLADTVDVNFAYRGEPGSVAVAAELSTADGWHSTVPLTEPTAFTGNGYDGSVSLDLAALEARAHAAAKATGHPEGPVSVSVVPHVTNSAGLDFEPALDLVVSPLQMAMKGEPEVLTVTGDAGAPGQTARTIGPDGWNLTAETARAVSGGILAAVMLAGVVLLWRARRETPGDEAEAIRRRYAALLIRVRPVGTPEGRPVIDVATFATLAKLAERYGLLVLHWSRSEVETFIVQDENVTYRYRAGEGSRRSGYAEQVAQENAR